MRYFFYEIAKKISRNYNRHILVPIFVISRVNGGNQYEINDKI